jgi:hypothetical protein
MSDGWPHGINGPTPTGRLPLVPKLYPDETLHSFVERLAGEYGMGAADLIRLLGFRTRLGGPPSQIPELEADDELFERLAKVTGYSVSRLYTLRLPLRPRPLPIGFRSGFCPRCWMERRKLQAAYLKRAWADPWTLVCERHGTLLSDRMAADRAGGWSTWSECFADRNRWAPLAREPWPQVWSQICSKLQLDPQTELELAKPWIIWLQNCHHEASTFREPEVEFLMVSDVINYLQTHWGYAKRWLPARFDSPRHASDTNICFDRSLSGDHFQRLVSIVMARHVWATIDGTPPQSSVLRELLAELRFPQRSPIEDWWLKRRLMQWPADRRVRGYELFGLSLADRWALVLHDPCRGCVSNAHPPLRTSNLKVCISPEWRCQLDPWMHVPPKNLQLESQCAPQQTPDEFAIQALLGNHASGTVMRTKAVTA